MTDMRIDALTGRGKPMVSFEFFPPKNDAGFQQLYKTIDELKSVYPSYVSVTYGAGGSTRQKTVELVERIQGEIGRPFKLQGIGTARVTASIGVVMASPEHGSAEEILEAADAAMYAAKGAGKARYVMVDGSEPAAMLRFLHGDSKEGRG